MERPKKITLRFEQHGKDYSREVDVFDAFELYGFTWCVHYHCRVDATIDSLYVVSELASGCSVTRSGPLYDSVEEAMEEMPARLKKLPEETVKEKVNQMIKYIESREFIPV